MTFYAPSAILAHVAESIATGLAPYTVHVRAHDGEFSPADKDFVTLPDPSVLVACLGAHGSVYFDSKPTTVDAIWAAFCITRNNSVTSQQGTRGAVAMDLAMYVTEIVDGNRWGDRMVTTPTRLRVVNDFKQQTKGLTVWSVFWTQSIEIQRLPAENLIHRLGSIHHVFAMGDEQTPDALATIVFPEPTP